MLISTTNSPKFKNWYIIKSYTFRFHGESALCNMTE